MLRSHDVAKGCHCACSKHSKSDVRWTCSTLAQSPGHVRITNYAVGNHPTGNSCSLWEQIFACFSRYIHISIALVQFLQQCHRAGLRRPCSKCFVQANITREFDSIPSTDDVELNGKPFGSLSERNLKEFVSSRERYHYYWCSPVDGLPANVIDRIAIWLYMLVRFHCTVQMISITKTICTCITNEVLSALQFKYENLLECTACKRMHFDSLLIGRASLIYEFQAIRSFPAVSRAVQVILHGWMSARGCRAFNSIMRQWQDHSPSINHSHVLQGTKSTREDNQLTWRIT